MSKLYFSIFASKWMLKFAGALQGFTKLQTIGPFLCLRAKSLLFLLMPLETLVADTLCLMTGLLLMSA